MVLYSSEIPYQTPPSPDTIQISRNVSKLITLDWELEQLCKQRKKLVCQAASWAKNLFSDTFYYQWKGMFPFCTES